MNVQHLGVSEDVRRAAEELTENEAASLLPAVPWEKSAQEKARGPPKLTVVVRRRRIVSFRVPLQGRRGSVIRHHPSTSAPLKWLGRHLKGHVLLFAPKYSPAYESSAG